MIQVSLDLAPGLTEVRVDIANDLISMLDSSSGRNS